MSIAIAETAAVAAEPASLDFAGVLASMIPVVIVLCLLALVWYKAAKNMAQIAADKGYTEKKWFHYCFWLGLAGFLMVCAMPDKNRR